MFLIEFHDHDEVVLAIAEMLMHIGIEFTLVANKKILSYCQDIRANKEELSLELLSTLSDQNCLLTSVTVYDHEWLKALSNNTLLGLIHNIHSFFYPQEYSIDTLSLVGIRKKIGDLWYQRKAKPEEVLSLLDYFTTPTEWQKEYAKKSGVNIHWVDSIPLSYSRKSVNRRMQKKIRIGIPGVVNQTRKDYSLLYEALTCCTFICPLELHFLGRCKGKSNNNKVLSFQNIYNIDVICYNSYRSTQEYYKSLCKMDFLISPMKKKFQLFNIIEEYGQSNYSGVESDIMKSGIPAILPSFYVPSHSIIAGVAFYQNSDSMVSILQEWVNKKRFLDKKERLKKSLKSVNINAQSTRLFNILVDCKMIGDQ